MGLDPGEIPRSARNDKINYFSAACLTVHTTLRPCSLSFFYSRVQVIFHRLLLYGYRAHSSEVSMWLFAVCSGGRCPFIWASSEGDDLPPFFCPLCRRQTLYRCHACGFPILLLSKGSVNECYHCHAPLRRPEPDQKRQQPSPQIRKSA